MRRIVITGATRGLGLEFCSQFLRNGDAVVAVGRDVPAGSPLDLLRQQWPDRLHIDVFDVTDANAVSRFGAQIAPLVVDILINNAGQIGPETHKSESGQNLDTLDLAQLRGLFEVNALAPLWFTRALLPSLRRSARPIVIVLGSTVGVARETFGDYYGYRMSKAAAHIAFATLAKDLARDRVLSSVICPGWVRTDLGGPNAALAVDDSVARMVSLIDRLSDEHNGRFVDLDGRLLEY